MQMIRFPRTILGTVCIPWCEDFSFDAEMFRQEIRFLTGNGLRDLYIFGTAGEGYAVNDALFEEITRVFVHEMECCGGTPMVGVISLTLSTIIERIERAAALGVKQFQISLPAWGVLSEKEVFHFFRETCGRFPDLQFLHYNLQRAGRLLTATEYAALAQEHENLVATKNSTRDTMLLQALLEKAPQLRHFFAEPSFAYASLLGECGFLISISSIHLQRAREYYEAGVNGDVKTLMTLQKELVTMVDKLISIVGNEAHMDASYDKVFCKLQHKEFPLRLLPPYSAVSDKTFAEYTDFLRSNFPHWLLSS
jgi:dihydrodipicolinate synthase/N-acetylneuraminate lyase